MSPSTVDYRAWIEAARPAEFAPVKRFPGDLNNGELFWRDHQPWLEEKGYLLRTRYRDGWEPSWNGTGKQWDTCEDGLPSNSFIIMDAVRVLDGAPVAMKRLLRSSEVAETDLASFFSSAALASDPRNHYVPVYDILQVPDDEDVRIIAMPLLRKFDDPKFETVREVVDFFHQIFEGLQFMHEHHVAHRDCNANNIMMDPKPLFPDLYHPFKIHKTRDLQGRALHSTRTQNPTKYYLIDFGLSRRYDEEDLPPSEPIILGGDKSAPEHKDWVGSCDPFPTDVYYMGNMIRRKFLTRRTGFAFMASLVEDMTRDDPAARPSMDEVVRRFDVVCKSLGRWKLSQRAVSPREFRLVSLVWDMAHRARQLVHWNMGPRSRPSSQSDTTVI